MKIYIASSWRNENLVISLSKIFRAWCHEVYCFAEHNECQVKFFWNDITDEYDDGITCLGYDYSKRAFKIDKAGLDWCNCLILVNPCGRDAHLEAGYVKGCGKLLFILGDFPKGEFSNMYHLADGLFRLHETGLNYLKSKLNEFDLIGEPIRSCDGSPTRGTQGQGYGLLSHNTPAQPRKPSHIHYTTSDKG